MLTVLSFGAGQDSTALLYKYLHDDGFRDQYAPDEFIVIMSNTGDEHPRTYQHIEKIKELCRANSLPFYLINPDMGYHSESWQTLRGFYDLKKCVGSKAFPKTCTDKLKIQPIYKFLEFWISTRFGTSCGRKKGLYEFTEKHGKIRMMIGIAAGEEGRMADPDKEPMKWKRENIKMVYPLVDLGMDRQACQDYIRSLGLDVPPPSNCMLCPFMSEQELLWLYRFYPEDYADWVRIEQNKIDANVHKGEKNLGVWGKKLLPQVLESAQEKYGHMTNAELEEYKMSHGHCVSSKY